MNNEKERNEYNAIIEILSELVILAHNKRINDDKGEDNDEEG